MRCVDQLSGGRLPFYNGGNPLVLDALQAGALPRAQAIYDELKPLLEFIVAGGLATTVKAGLELLGVGVGDPRRRLLPLDDKGRVALKKLLTEARAQHRLRRGFRSPSWFLRVACVA